MVLTRRSAVRYDRDADATHQWWIWHGFECCAICGIVRRADRKNKPCRGPVKIVCKEA